MRLLHAATLATLVMAGAGLTALAQTAPPAPPPGGPGMMGPGPRGPGMMGERSPRGPAMLFTRIDADKNGRVTMAEAWGFFQGRFTDADANKDGVLVLEEALAMRLMPPPEGAPAPELSPMRARMMAAMFRAMDANRDGKVTQDELRPAVEAQFRALDANGDNGITLDELPMMMGRHMHGHGMGPHGPGMGPDGFRGPPGPPPPPPPR